MGVSAAKACESERGLRGGAVLGVVSTNALELGIDIGSLDVAVMLCRIRRRGGPQAAASRCTRQQEGRSGRRGSTLAAVLVLNSTPLNQFIVRNPEYFFVAPAEEGRIHPDNLHILTRTSSSRACAPVAAALPAILDHQLLRASSSVTLNVAEVIGPSSHGVKRRHYEIAHGRGAESIASLDPASPLGVGDGSHRPRATARALFTQT